MDPSVTQAIITGLAGCGGMLVGGLVVYHRVEGMLTSLKDGVAKMDQEHRDELKQVWAKFDTVMPVQTCKERQHGCFIQFAVFKEGQEEIKELFKELRADLRAELKLLRDCITQATQGKC